MLPADCAHRLVSLLTQALEDCDEEKQRLQQNLTRCQALLGDWNSQVPESPILEVGKDDIQGSEPSAKELEELELLNKALERALRVRSKFQQAPCEAAEGAKATAEKPVTSAALKQQAARSKASTSKTVAVSSVGGKFMPSKKPTAYMLKAPYRTDPDVRRPQAKTSARLSSRASKVPGKKRSPKGPASPKANLPVKIAGAGHEKACAAGEPGRQPGSSEAPHLAKRSPSFGDSSGGADFSGAVPPLHEAEGMHAAAAESLVTQSHMGGAPHGTGTTCTLQEKGSELKLPLPYKKAFSKYTRLLEKCRLCQTTPDAAVARNRFMEKLQATFCSPSPAFSPAEVRKELMHLRDVYSLVRQHMEAENPASLGENPPWERQYESLLTLEGLQTIVDQCLDKVDKLSEAMSSHSKMFPAHSACSKECSSVCCASLGKPRCRDVETVGPPPLLFYSSLKELKDMEALKLNVAMLHQRLEIQKAMEAELLPLLEPGAVQEGSRALLYRAVYTLLCEGGEHFPVLVHDEESSS
ncbi:tubulin epsilon and delta complex protein 2 [Elgaria multicarinata webbii]|uniref:tubulin epsilon and delta complex protein 2 n=1 Tax=Elgaria multicarinata webbii TaxID=159646 RepID=UPI002FCD60D9